MKNKLIDSYGRVLDYLRVSVTDRCNLRCVYCMPPEGVEWKPHDSIMTFEQIIRIINIFSALGIKKIRVTGGEPLLRRGVSSFLNKLKSIPGIENVTLTTNGILLSAYLDDVKLTGAALPDSINISLDSMSKEKYNLITRSGSNRHITQNPALPDMIIPAIDRLLENQITVKINCVPVRGINEDEIIPLISLAKEKNIIVRFIELMPVGSASGLLPVPGNETAKIIKKKFGTLTPYHSIKGSGPAVYYSLKSFKGKIGFINAVTRGFCENCNRLRLTSTGFLKLCLSDSIGLDLKELITAGKNDDEISRAIGEAVHKKPRFHTLSSIYGGQEPQSESMSKIGG
ncbi:MAG: GTP 3',8-cyclase MoaA [Treponema sp.]|nr:GTP 3',8-cyclase MoaA [Treponema sp.]